MARNYNFGEPITCHCWNNECDQIALSMNNNFVHIYGYSGKSWEILDTLEEHELRVTALDWSPKTNQIVTCGEDRNAYVWTCFEEGWKPTLVLLRINRAAMCVRWSPEGNKFAVGSSAKLVAVCHFDEENDWWVSKHIKKNIKSTVTCVDWHPDNILIAVGSTDFRTRLYSANLPECDNKVITNTPWGSADKFGTLLAEFSNEYGGWVYGLNFSPNGLKLAWCSHDSTISVVDMSTNESLNNHDSSVQHLQQTNLHHNNILTNQDVKLVVEPMPFLPCKTIQWINESLLIAAGYDCCPLVYTYQDQKLTFWGKLDQVANKAATKELTGHAMAMSKFQSMDKHASSAQVETTLETLHQNTINEIRLIKGADGNPDIFSTVGIDGLMVMWDISIIDEKNSPANIQSDKANLTNNVPIMAN